MNDKITETKDLSKISGSFSKKFYTTDVIKKTTKFTNEQIVDLCRNGIVQPKKTLDGKIYFTKDDFLVMEKLAKAHEELGLLENSKEESLSTENVKENIKQAPRFELKQKIKLPKISTFNDKEISIESKNDNPVENCNIKEFENNIINKMEALLSKKLDGLDEVIVELIRTKTELNMLRSKLDEMEAKNYTLSNEVNSYKNIGFGLYIKSKEDIKN